ncbi:MAG: nitrilase-related carbon-nitrogen hydrolase, partial [Nocardioidaceae bacterium]
MPQLRIALAQTNPTVGDLEGNLACVVESVRRAADLGAHLVALPEMMITGYPIEDLALRTSFVDASRRSVNVLAKSRDGGGLGKVTAVIGCLDRGPDAAERVGPPKGS